MSVVDINARLMAKRATTGEQNFVVCPCQERIEDATGFHPVVAHDARGAIVVAIVCGTCGKSINVDAGRLVEGE